MDAGYLSTPNMPVHPRTIVFYDELEDIAQFMAFLRVEFEPSWRRLVSECQRRGGRGPSTKDKTDGHGEWTPTGYRRGNGKWKLAIKGVELLPLPFISL